MGDLMFILLGVHNGIHNLVFLNKKLCLSQFDIEKFRFE